MKLKVIDIDKIKIPTKYKRILFRKINISKKIINVFVTLVILVALIFSGYLYVSAEIKKPLRNSDIAVSPDQVFMVVLGDSVFQIAEKLEQEKIIENKNWFSVYMFLRGWAARSQAGKYSLSAAMNIPDIANKLVNGRVASKEDIEVTIPEGFNVWQIDYRLSTYGLIERGKVGNFDGQLLANEPIFQYLKSQTTNTTTDSFKFLGLEGYLFPDTYRFAPYFTTEQILKKMLNNLDWKIDEQMRADIVAQGKTLHEIITMASIIEKEVTTYEELQIASGIFWKRIKDKHPLQSCATLAYIIGKNKQRYSMADTRINSPYNTYINIGLPPGPISNPGLDAIKAAIYPIETNYYFFLAKPNGETVFSETLGEHNRNIYKYLK